MPPPLRSARSGVDLPAGREELRRALVHLRASVGLDAPSTRRALAQLERSGS